MSSETQQEQVSQERELARMRYALDDIMQQATMALRYGGSEAHVKALDNIKALVDRGTTYLSDGFILREWDDAEISEGIAHKMLGVTRLEARAMLDERRIDRT